MRKSSGAAGKEQTRRKCAQKLSIFATVGWPTKWPKLGLGEKFKERLVTRHRHQLRTHTPRSSIAKGTRWAPSQVRVWGC